MVRPATLAVPSTLAVLALVAAVAPRLLDAPRTTPPEAAAAQPSAGAHRGAAAPAQQPRQSATQPQTPAPAGAGTAAPAPGESIAQSWALPPILTLTAKTPAAAGTAARIAAARGWIALAPSVQRRLAAGADASALAPLLAIPRSTMGPLIVFSLEGRSARVQAATLTLSRSVVHDLHALPAGVRPTILLAPAPTDVADTKGPPPPAPGKLRTLVPVYMAAGARYGINWRILAAINLVETNLGQNTSTSTAGAVGWMQFMPSTWARWGTDGNGDGIADPYEPHDAIFSAARYLEAAHGRTDIRRAIFAYNHADWYVRLVLAKAAALPSELTATSGG